MFKEADIVCGHFDAPFKPECADVILALGSINWGDHDDIAHIADVLEGDENEHTLDYVAQFLSGVAHSAHDGGADIR